ncbi:helix-turn-helix domain-containing protein [Bordetella hinzii]|uniref:helix-turn-helix domain-containing protein n=1 Tax=Bordetella hinzii TaxID=103855 RepID=UPI0016894A15|nr:helix-turn-helix transcriptional regulator [Bordetella hinzii]MBZ0073646.1 helix-turn-helix transcriptional regulator [Bordetella hinzii]MBZ0077878.1 helix-turn-helix transcriptional regulator [Bordetella hinzii]MBZ0082443.1 helix-turn-helix transcriptional regulator [Bordetella hinzii]QWF39290.1 helix-turn-helix transcriptional regulator [Bordetella hinzii]QWF43837.1 helix-turn-helix transcriptional regulator [Bordetella hinzii]
MATLMLGDTQHSKLGTTQHASVRLYLMSLGERIRERRKLKHLTLQQVAEAFGINRASVSDWEHNNTRPDVERLVKLARILGTSTDFLLTGRDATGDAPEWPFHDIDPSRWALLPDRVKGKIEGRVLAQIEEWEEAIKSAHKAA